MKSSLFLILSLSSLFITALSHPNPKPFSDGGKPKLVLDADGGKLLTGVNYLVLPVTRGRGGGLLPANVHENSSSCPRDIIQDSSEIQTGLPVVFEPVDDSTGSVTLSTDVNVKFFTPTVCANETAWTVGRYDALLKQYFVVTGGVTGNPGPETIANWFKIEKADDTDYYYKFVFCPSVCSTCEVVCKDVGIYVGNGGTRFLALSDTPLIVMFKKTFPWATPTDSTPFPPAPPSPDTSSADATFKSLFFAFVLLQFSFLL